MMFKNAIYFRISNKWNPDLQAVEEALTSQRFLPCSASQAQSMGFIEPRGEAHGPLIESVGGQWLVCLCVESKKVPASLVQQKLIERLQQIESSTGRKPGKKECKEIKEDIVHQLLPQAFPQQQVIRAWINPQEHYVVVDAGSQSKSDLILTSLVKAIEGFSCTNAQTQESPASCMAHWLRTDESPNEFTVDRECELKATDESKSVVRYGRHALDIEEIKQHVNGGKNPTRLAMTWQDRVSFMLTDNMQIKKISFLDLSENKSKEEKESGFDADVAICTGELSGLIPDLMEALGGEVIIPD